MLQHNNDRSDDGPLFHWPCKGDSIRHSKNICLVSAAFTPLFVTFCTLVIAVMCTTLHFWCEMLEGSVTFCGLIWFQSVNWCRWSVHAPKSATGFSNCWLFRSIAVFVFFCGITIYQMLLCKNEPLTDLQIKKENCSNKTRSECLGHLALFEIAAVAPLCPWRAPVSSLCFYDLIQRALPVFFFPKQI